MRDLHRLASGEGSVELLQNALDQQFAALSRYASCLGKDACYASSVERVLVIFRRQFQPAFRRKTASLTSSRHNSQLSNG